MNVGEAFETDKYLDMVTVNVYMNITVWRYEVSVSREIYNGGYFLQYIMRIFPEDASVPATPITVNAQTLRIDAFVFMRNYTNFTRYK